MSRLPENESAIRKSGERFFVISLKLTSSTALKIRIATMIANFREYVYQDPICLPSFFKFQLNQVNIGYLLQLKVKA